MVSCKHSLQSVYFIRVELKIPVLNLVFTEAESTVSRAHLLDDDGQSVKSIDTESTLPTEERGYRQGIVVDQSSKSF